MGRYMRFDNSFEQYILKLSHFRSTDDFNGAQCKAVCVEAGMIALRREATVVTHEDFMDAILEVQAKKKQTLNYYA